jgi:hypothetical protein
MEDIIDNSSLKPINGTGTTPVSGQQEQGATQTTEQTETPGTQTTEQDPSAATQTTDANQASGGQGNAGVSQQKSQITPIDGTTQPTDSSIPSTGTVVGNGTAIPADDGTTQPSNSTTSRTDSSTPQTGTVVGNGTTVPDGDGTTQPTDGSATQPTYLADWSKVSFSDAVKTGDKSIADYMRDYNKWARANNQEPLDVYDMMQAINGNDISESYAANEKAKRKLERQQRWEQIGNVLAHLGNFVGTIAGAPSATYETGEHLTARQQAVRDAIQKQQGDPKNILAMIWKDRADQRARELNNANIALQGARKANVEGQTANQKAQSDANVALKGAQQKQAETAADENQAQTDYVKDKNKREQDLQPFKKKNIQSSTNANNARANASNASAAHSAAETRATNIRAYGSQYQANRYRIWAKNRRLHPNESREFMKANNIHSTDMKNWTPTLIDQYNGYIADKFSNGGKGGAKASSLLD